MAIEEDLESCGSRALDSAAPRHHRQKLDVYNEVLRRIQDFNYEEANLPGFDDQLWLHFNRLPARYALDVNANRTEDVLRHKRLLQLAEDPANRPVFEVHLVRVYPVPHVNSVDHRDIGSPMKEDAQSSYNHNDHNVHPPATFGSSPHLEALVDHRNSYQNGDTAVNSTPRPRHEITFSTIDRPKLLSQLTSLLAEIGLNIEEAHAFSTADGFSLDVFVVEGWLHEETDELKSALEKEILKYKSVLQEQSLAIQQLVSSVSKHSETGFEPLSGCVEIPYDGTDVWEIDFTQLKIDNKVGSGSFGDLYRGIYRSQEVAIKILKLECVNSEMLREFSQEVYIMSFANLQDESLRKIQGMKRLGFKKRNTLSFQRIACLSPSDEGSLNSQRSAPSGIIDGIFMMTSLFTNAENSMWRSITFLDLHVMGSTHNFPLAVRHKNVVQLIGACTQAPNLCIVTEFMSRGSIYDYLHKQKGVFKLPSLLKVAIDVSKGMNYLHQNNIVHRDLKTANLLMDENEVVKVADFGVARVQSHSGVMTVETGTYRWMAPEVIEYKPYGYKADIFSFGISLWELLTGEIPYSYLTPLQAAVGVVQKGLRPKIPKNAHPKLAKLLESCWQQDPTLRPNFSGILETLQRIAKEVGNEGDGRTEKSSGGFFSALRKSHH